MEVCSVCDEEYNKKNRKKIVCCACEYQQCQECVKKYLILLPQIEPKCMKCNVEWKINFIKNNLPKIFLEKEYKKHQKNIIFEKEKQHFPQLMNEIDEEKERDKILDESAKLTEQIGKQIKVKKRLQSQIKKIRYKDIEEEIECPYCNSQYINKKNKKEICCIKCKRLIVRQITELRQEDQEKIAQLEKEIEEYRQKMEQLIDKEEKLSTKIGKLGNKKQRQLYYIHCPKNECNGLVNSEKDQCGICTTRVCKKCNEAMEQGHECRQENIESAKKIRSQCKQCPTCKAQIYRIEGCNDMFCVKCKTSFNWVTGQKMQHTTNPHYYEYIRQNNIQDEIGQEDPDICGNRLINIRELTQILECKYIDTHPEEGQYTSIGAQSLFEEQLDRQVTRRTNRQYLYESEKKKIIDLHQKINHIESIEIRKLEENNDNNRLKIQGLCKEYLKNQLNQEDLRDKIYKIRKQQEKKRSIQQILEAYVEVAKKEINEIPQQRCIENIIKKIEIIDNFRDYIQQQIEQTKNDYDSKMTIVV